MKTDAQRFPADGRGILCGHNFPPRQCPYAKCGYREALERLKQCEVVLLLCMKAIEEEDGDLNDAAFDAAQAVLEEK